jgi:hypothetical protein
VVISTNCGAVPFTEKRLQGEAASRTLLNLEGATCLRNVGKHTHDPRHTPEDLNLQQRRCQKPNAGKVGFAGNLSVLLFVLSISVRVINTAKRSHLMHSVTVYLFIFFVQLLPTCFGT